MVYFDALHHSSLIKYNCMSVISHCRVAHKAVIQCVGIHGAFWSTRIFVCANEFLFCANDFVCVCIYGIWARDHPEWV